MKTAWPIILDVLALLGVAAATYGAYLIYTPAAWIGGGLALVLVCWMVSRGLQDAKGDKR